MDPPPAPPPAPPSSAVPPSSSAADSAQSSPRSRATDSWDDHAAPGGGGGGGGGGGKLRLMCSYGGHIVPRPHDKSLCYVGGDTRIVLAERHSSLSELAARLSKTLIGGGSFTLKYQLPNEDLDSLISVTTDEDLENMIDEYDRTTSSSNKLSRLRLFLFPSGSDSASSIGSLLESSTKSEDWFLNALNGSGVLSRGVSESQSVNSLLGLDDDGGGGAATGSVEANPNKSGKRGQDVASVPDSPMLDTTSSFGSASSSPSMANLPPIRVHVVEDGSNGGGGGMRLQDQKIGVEEQFSQMSLAPAMPKQDEGFVISSPPPPIPSSMVAPAVVPTVSVNSAAVSGEHHNRVFSDDEKSEQGVPVGYWKPPQLPPQPQFVQVQQKPNGGFDLPSPDSVSSDSSFTNAISRPKPTIYQDPVTGQLHSGTTRVSADPNINIYDPNSRAPLLQQQIQDQNLPPGYVLAPQFNQEQQQQQQQQHQQPQQFLHPGAHFIHRQQPTGPVQISSYYPIYPSQQHPLYFVPARPSQGYNLSSMPQFNLNESTTAAAPQPPPNPSIVNAQTRVPAQPKPEMAAGMYQTAGVGAGAPPLSQQYVGFPQIHHASQSVTPNSAGVANYAYEFADPAHAQMYYSQALPPQYQTMTTAPNAGSLETASHVQGDNMKHQMRT